MPTRPAPPAAAWTFLTNHSHVPLSLAADPEGRLRYPVEAGHAMRELRALGPVGPAQSGR